MIGNKNIRKHSDISFNFLEGLKLFCEYDNQWNGMRIIFLSLDIKVYLQSHI